MERDGPYLDLMDNSASSMNVLLEDTPAVNQLQASSSSPSMNVLLEDIPATSLHSSERANFEERGVQADPAHLKNPIALFERDGIGSLDLWGARNHGSSAFPAGNSQVIKTH
ncbi:hypothetical protein PCASD_10678 [Puccinia coronata f. sp. avenae]|jgi:hypothetical protein|uniref:Uncharacterized protein n=1 Tax=Puccinia coronata f. sp. avenae TaxID=200324 RepID=A0A2N5UI73_9BASI|nr:hypothetical protein PCASD_10678 [Puccinia coronata f. sp. avenae]